ncbi:hypothetical protein PAXINDRAFT_85743 [Paxillus involutus ATCC 200175]|uniref:GAG-pre-integrase domain-containing protein n=1 Tax=Paxillus involutus ATCC 200175 TaxID=664439 RepID=A0A0C9TTV1_PAXIN|nr:hypothetical protein PAXINDRAFT_85743 [Paxillus involutus ATCC 200175]
MWHRKFGHIGVKGLKCLLTEELVDGFTVDEHSPSFDCNACIQVKQERSPYPKHMLTRSEHPGKLTHTDVWGPARVTTMSGVRYYVSFVNNHTH